MESTTVRTIFAVHVTRLAQPLEVGSCVRFFDGGELAERSLVMNGKALPDVLSALGTAAALFIYDRLPRFQPAAPAIRLWATHIIRGIRPGKVERPERAAAGNGAESRLVVAACLPRLARELPPALLTGERERRDVVDVRLAQVAPFICFCHARPRTVVVFPALVPVPRPKRGRAVKLLAAMVTAYRRAFDLCDGAGGSQSRFGLRTVAASVFYGCFFYSFGHYAPPFGVSIPPFGGVGSVAYVAVEQGRKGISVELKPSYWRQSVRNLESVGQEQHEQAVGLFALNGMDVA